MHVTIDDLRAAMGDLRGNEADQETKNYYTVQAETLLAQSATDDPDTVLRFTQNTLQSLNTFSAWYDSGRGYIGPRYSTSQIVRQNLQQAQSNANSRKQAAAGQAPQRQVETAPAKEVSVWAETAKALPAAVVARAEEIKKGDIWTEEQRTVVAAPVAAVGISPTVVPKATAPSISITEPTQAPSGPSWWDRTIDWAFTGPAPTPTPAPAPAAPVAAPPVVPVAPAYVAPPAYAPLPVVATTVAEQPPTPAPPSSIFPATPAAPPPPPEKPLFSGRDIVSMIRSAAGAAAQVGTAAAESSSLRTQAQAELRKRPARPAPVPYRQPAPQQAGIGTNEVIALGAGFALLAGIAAVVVIRSRDDDEEDDED